jgi:hypothetical protein
MAVVKPPDITIPGATGKPGGLGEKLENALVRFAGRVLNSAKETLSGIIRFALDTFLEGIEPFMIRAFKPMLTMVRNTDGCPNELQSMIDLALSGESQAGAAILGVISGTAQGAIMGSFLGPMTSGWTRLANKRWRPQRPDLVTLQALWRRRQIDPAAYYQFVGEIGWPVELATAIESITAPRPDIMTLAMDTFRRGVDLGTLRDELKKRGYLDPDIDSILNVLKPIPGAGDLIRMAVRDAWNEGVAARYGYDEDYPAEFAEWMKKQGFDEGWSRRWWRSHWELPGPTMAMEMLHRTSMTRDDYATLLKIADYPAKFRQWMTEIAYSPYTRVDIRRMYSVGVLKSYDELVRAYKDIGYDDDKAKKLSDFTVLEYGETEREATKTEVLNAYGIGRLSLQETRVYLADMGYPGWVVDTYITRVDLGRTVGIAKSQIGHAQTMYVNGQMSKTDVYTALGKIPLASAEIERYLEEWEISRTAKIARPSRADLLRFFLQNEMQEAEFRQELKGFRLSDRYIDWYVADAKRKLVLQAQKESDDALAEQMKVHAAAVKSATDIAIADIAVQIAQLNLTIADLKASATPDMTLEEVDELTNTVRSCQIQIKTLQLKKAQTWKAYLVEKEAK